MKLTKAQINTLREISLGHVEWYNPVYARYDGYATGASTAVVKRLANMGLIKFPAVKAGYSGACTLTELGQAILLK